MRSNLSLLLLLALPTACGPAQHGEACSASSDCVDGAICHNGTCNGGLRACVGNAECGGGEVCLRGICQVDNSECEGTWDCPSGFVCYDGDCRRPEVGNPCARHQDCGPHMYCPTPRYECTELTGGACWTRDGCEPGQDCEGVDAETGIGGCGGAPTPQDAGPPRDTGASQDCESNTDCPSAAPICYSGRCVVCVSDRHCDNDARCQDGACVGGDQCSYDGDCEVGERCVDRQCVEDSGCRGDGDCANGQVCQGGQCVDQGGCTHDGQCPQDQACQGGQCVPRGGGLLSYGQATQAASQCQSNYAGVWDNQAFCSVPCGSSVLDCPQASMCTTMLGSAMSYCVPSTRTGGHLSQGQDTRCQGATDCRSGVCANTQNGAICQRDCQRDSHCIGGSACMAVALDQQGTVARVCGTTNGTVPNGSACQVGGQNSCRSGICDNTTNQCQPLCCSSADCGAGMACNPTIISQTGPVLVRVCGRPQGPGRATVGAACGVDNDCLSATCLNGRCADTCCTDADCPGLRCRPYNAGDQQNPVLISLCQ